jgi:acyl-coenzyme A synthetase/AMP-(fatty) acid ligase
MIMNGPVTIHPGWLEKRLEECMEVVEVIVVPVPDDKMYQELCACIVPRTYHASGDDIRKFFNNLFVTPDDSSYKPCLK